MVTAMNRSYVCGGTHNGSNMWIPHIPLRLFLLCVLLCNSSEAWRVASMAWRQASASKKRSVSTSCSYQTISAGAHQAKRVKRKEMAPYGGDRHHQSENVTKASGRGVGLFCSHAVLMPVISLLCLLALAAWRQWRISEEETKGEAKK